MPATTVLVATADRAAAVEAVASARTSGGDPITVIRRTPHPPMVGDLRLDRRLSRALRGSRSGR